MIQTGRHNPQQANEPGQALAQPNHQHITDANTRIQKRTKSYSPIKDQ